MRATCQKGHPLTLDTTVRRNAKYRRCRTCWNEDQKRYRESPKGQATWRLSYQAKKDAFRAVLAELKRGGCIKCGSCDKLEFHHRDPATKYMPIAVGYSWSRARLDAELAKCDLLCRPCHMAQHYPKKSVAA